MKALRFVTMLVVAMMLVLGIGGVARADDGATEAQNGMEGGILRFPDLLVVQAHFSGNDTLQMPIRIKNQGSVKAGKFAVSVWADNGPTKIYYFNNGLQAGQEGQWVHHFTQLVPNGADIHITVDCFWQVTELNEQNNYFTEYR